MLVLAKIMLDRTFVSVVQDGDDVVAGVGNTDVRIVKPSTALGLLGHVEDVKYGLRFRPRDERRRRGALLLEVPFPSLQWRPS